MTIPIHVFKSEQEKREFEGLAIKCGKEIPPSVVIDTNGRRLMSLRTQMCRMERKLDIIIKNLGLQEKVD